MSDLVGFSKSPQNISINLFPMDECAYEGMEKLIDKEKINIY